MTFDEHKRRFFELTIAPYATFVALGKFQLPEGPAWSVETLGASKLYDHWLNGITDGAVFTFQYEGEERMLAFERGLKEKGIPCTLRRSRGLDIEGACGQLRLKAEGNMVKS